ncbi:hypothetical protein DPMN_041382 [Dreissena polymorpha]|uniref:Uncharacterized protein n=1 Tax=Dreissena polymorpha TaxID=45954 RepID=A0A9D4CYN7_DREPO|nr:hypothetical protein DPMN_041382 [Dreissena polymorpha]
MFHVGARLMFKCDPGSVEKSRESSMTCLQNGSWSYTPECVDIDECASNPCKNGATSNNLQNKYTCMCAAGWQGTNCDQDIDECASNPCQNSAVCNNLQNKYTCTCAEEWQGTNCDQGSKARCPDKFVIYGENCYHFSPDTKTYSEAKVSCRNVHSNSYLVEINSKEENDFLAGQVNVLNRYYTLLASTIWRMKERGFGTTVSNLPHSPSGQVGNRTTCRINTAQNCGLMETGTTNIALTRKTTFVRRLPLRNPFQWLKNLPQFIEGNFIEVKTTQLCS